MAPEAHNAAISSVSAALSLGFGVLSTLRARRRVGRVVSTRSGGGGSREDEGREDATARRNVEGPRVQTHRIAASTSVNSASGASVVIAPDHAASRARSGMGERRRCVKACQGVKLFRERHAGAREQLPVVCEKPRVETRMFARRKGRLRLSFYRRPEVRMNDEIATPGANVRPSSAPSSSRARDSPESV